ncbi:hypothetical protein KIL84_000993 [Mauremys mutica]|uniref:Uncharacterized protein n=1 Tax=Mauremys mutica TaxID=74926 RepID=A0A9D4ATA9_9SAUR|nr:hypothetical protein KIL84_000993 [Mauremys mutica]
MVLSDSHSSYGSCNTYGSFPFRRCFLQQGDRFILMDFQKTFYPLASATVVRGGAHRRYLGFTFKAISHTTRMTGGGPKIIQNEYFITGTSNPVLSCICKVR